MKWIALTGLILLVAVAAWGVGEMHRQNCIRDKRAECSVLPWKSGKETWDSPSVDWSSGSNIQQEYDKFR